MIRKIITIDEKKCNGCGLCVTACHEGAIELIDGKARLAREDFCDGLGDCLPRCPSDAISFEEREAPAYNEEAVKALKALKELKRKETVSDGCSSCGDGSRFGVPLNWPVQLKLVPAKAEVYNNADLLVSADCACFVHPKFHRDFINGKVVFIACPKLDGTDYSEKLTDIFARNDFRSVTVARMEVPCCGGLELAVKKAIRASGRVIPCQTVTFTAEGEIL